MPVKADVFISHTHWDHIQGFPFFVPSYIPGNSFRVFGPPSDVQNLTIKQIMEMQTNYEYFPVRISQLGSSLEYIDSREGVMLEEDGIRITACKLNHPVNCFAYKVEADGKTYVYGGDHEPFRNIYRDDENCELDEEFLQELDANIADQNGKIIEFCRDADFVSWDSQYTEEEYATKIGWGHSTYEADIELALKAGIKKIALTHHDPVSKDSLLQEREVKYTALAKDKGVDAVFAREGAEYTL
jgi:ribonuclease BN (tRNA processing enzyme)